jgi:hypothetical protein
VITQLGVGEALVSTLDEKGSPSVVEKTLMRPPESQMGPVTPQQRQALIKNSVLYGVFDTLVDRESAYEILKQRADEATLEAEQKKSEPRSSSRTRQTPMEAFIKSAARSIGSQLGRQLIRGILGSLTGRGR